MEKIRVSKGEWYWFINSNFILCTLKDDYSIISNSHYNSGNYFSTQEEAETIIRKLRYILKGADVIETPSKDDIEDAMKTSVTESILCVSPYVSFTPKATDLLECAWLNWAEFLKSKIVK